MHEDSEPVELRPWEAGESILAVIAGNQNPRDGEIALPDEPPADPTTVRWGAGSWDGVVLHHMGPADDDAPNDTATEIASRLRELVRTSGDRERLAVYRIAQAEMTPSDADAVVDHVGYDTELVAALAPHARWLVMNGRHRGPVKLGIVLLGMSGGPSDVGTLMTLARHDEFTIYCVVAIQNLLDDPTDALWQIAQSVHGWGKIHTVERLAALVDDHAELKRWLLTDGCANSVMNEYLACTCATSGELAAALTEGSDDALLDGACTITTALCIGGPAEDMTDYAEGPVMVARLLEQLRERCTTLERLACVDQLSQWLADDDGSERRHTVAWSPSLRERLRAQCDAILRAPEWPERIEREFESGDPVREWQAWHLAPRIGVDLWEQGFEKLHGRPLDDGLVYNLTRTRDPERRRRLVDWAEEHLHLDEVATGPDRHLFPVAEFRADAQALRFLVQEMRDDCYSQRLVRAALRSPVVGTRNTALNVLDALPQQEWGATVHQALRQLDEDEPDDKVRARVRALLG